jgi:hypothetical protein
MSNENDKNMSDPGKIYDALNDLAKQGIISIELVNDFFGIYTMPEARKALQDFFEIGPLNPIYPEAYGKALSILYDLSDEDYLELSTTFNELMDLAQNPDTQKYLKEFFENLAVRSEATQLGEVKRIASIKEEALDIQHKTGFTQDALKHIRSTMIAISKNQDASTPDAAEQISTAIHAFLPCTEELTVGAITTVGSTDAEILKIKSIDFSISHDLCPWETKEKAIRRVQSHYRIGKELQELGKDMELLKELREENGKDPNAPILGVNSHSVPVEQAAKRVVCISIT